MSLDRSPGEQKLTGGYRMVSCKDKVEIGNSGSCQLHKNF
jgi:hypothetical protein